jgi:hypothetical protein
MDQGFFMYVSGYLYIGMYIRKSMGLFRDGAVISKSPSVLSPLHPCKSYNAGVNPRTPMLTP